jgi:ParB-like chromosome segregation protein Spo0J
VADTPAQPSYQVDHVAIDEIEIEGERRRVNPEKLKDIKTGIATLGLREPLTIRMVKGHKYLVVGFNRLEVARSLGWKKVPCVFFKGGAKKARLWQISENLHRNELTALEECEQTVEFLKLAGLDTTDPKESKKKGKRGRPAGGDAEAARKLPGKGTTEAKRMRILRARPVAALEPTVKSALIDAGFDDNPTKLTAVARIKGTEARLKKVEEMKSGRKKPQTARRRRRMTRSRCRS